MKQDRDRKLNLSDPGRDAVADELELVLRDADASGEEAACDDAGSDSFLERLPATARRRRTPD